MDLDIESDDENEHETTVQHPLLSDIDGVNAEREAFTDVPRAAGLAPERDLDETWARLG